MDSLSFVCIPLLFMAASLPVSRLSAFDLLCYTNENDRTPVDPSLERMDHRW
jgi:hypothetical protein